MMIEIISGIKKKIRPVNHRKGTTVSVKKLFFSTPARLKFLKSNGTETRYCREVIKHLAKVGGKLVFGGRISRLMIGEVEDLWDSVAIAQYPSRKAMLEMLMDPDYQKSEEHREAGLEGQLNIEIKEGEL